MLSGAALRTFPGLVMSVSCTTRAPRPGEADGREYHFVAPEVFQAMIDGGEFFEWAEVHGNRYGTSRTGITARLQAGEDVVLEIDWQGALQIKKIFPNAVLIFILVVPVVVINRRAQRRAEEMIGA